MTLAKIVVTLFAALFLLPIFWMIAASLQSPNDLYRLPFQWLPEQSWRWANYPEAWTRMGFSRALRNSLTITTVVVAGQVVSSAVIGFLIVQPRRLSSRGLGIIFFVAYLVPYQLTWIPSYFALKQLGWLDGLTALIVPFLAGPFGALVIATYVRSLPNDQIEAAHLEGADSATLLWFVILPQIIPALRMVMIATFLFTWSDLVWPLLMTHSTELRTVTVSLLFFQDELGSNWPQLMAGSIMTTIPIVVGIAFLGRNWNRERSRRPSRPGGL